MLISCKLGKRAFSCIWQLLCVVRSLSPIPVMNSARSLTLFIIDIYNTNTNIDIYIYIYINSEQARFVEKQKLRHSHCVAMNYA